MSISLIASGDIETYGISHYIADTEEDLKKIRTADKIGSTVYVINNKTKYILNGEKQWVIKNNDEQNPSIEIEALTINESGVYTAPSGKAYSPVTVNIYYPAAEEMSF